MCLDSPFTDTDLDQVQSELSSASLRLVTLNELIVDRFINDTTTGKININCCLSCQHDIVLIQGYYKDKCNCLCTGMLLIEI